VNSTISGTIKNNIEYSGKKTVNAPTAKMLNLENFILVIINKDTTPMRI
jgi:hypothetical protein